MAFDWYHDVLQLTENGSSIGTKIKRMVLTPLGSSTISRIPGNNYFITLRIVRFLRMAKEVRSLAELSLAICPCQTLFRRYNEKQKKSFHDLNWGRKRHSWKILSRDRAFISIKNVIIWLVLYYFPSTIYGSS